MTRFLVRRIAQSVLVIVGVILLTFVIVRLVPGDPAVAYAGSRATPEQLEAVRAQLGLDAPVFVQFMNYLGGLLQGDLGTSIHTRQPVLSDLMQFLPASLELVVFSMMIAVPAGLAIGKFSARHQGSGSDRLMRVMTVLSVSFPSFWLALLLQSILATRLGWFPIAGEYQSALDTTSPLSMWTGVTIVDALLTGNWPILASSLHHLVLPAVVLSIYPMGVIAQQVRAGLSEELQQDHIRTARALGFSPREIVRRFALRPVLSPILTLIALIFAYTLVNAFIVESIFNWPGIGRYTAQSIQSLDTPAIAGVTLVVAIVYLLVNLAADVSQAIIDPRVRVK